MEQYLAEDSTREQYTGHVSAGAEETELQEGADGQPWEEPAIEQIEVPPLEPPVGEVREPVPELPLQQSAEQPAKMVKTTQELPDSDVEILTDESPQEFADRIADRIVERLKAELIDEMIERLIDRLTPGKMT